MTIATHGSKYTILMIFFRLQTFCFPVACGHRRCFFSGKSSIPLRDILLSVDTEIPTEEELQEFKDKALLYLNDIKTEFENTMTRTTFKFIFSGSAIERYGIPFMLSYKPTDCACNSTCSVNVLHTDLDVMFCSEADKACFSGREGNILVEPLIADDLGFTGYARLTSLTPGYEGNCVNSKLIRDQAKSSVENARVLNLPGVPCCCGMSEFTPKIKLDSKGPAIKINIKPLFEADITLCFHCPEWPTISDWPSRQRYWPSVVEAQRIMSLGCHLVAKPAPNDEEQTSWRFSFSSAEVELSKLVPDTARKCFLALKVILKDHLQPVVPEIGSYHIKTIFLNTLEKLPVGFWVDGNIEECFLTLLGELRDALLSMKCPHHWFSFINLFNIEENDLQRLAKKVKRIIQDPAPFIYDDGCCCLSPCCFRVPQYTFNRRSSQQFLVEYDEVTISVDEAVTQQVHDLETHPQQFPRSPFPIPREEECQETNARPGPLAVSLPPIHSNERGLRVFPDELNADSFGDEIPLVVILPPIHDT